MSLDFVPQTDGDCAAYWQGAYERMAARNIQVEGALKPFADLGVGSGPEDETETYRITRKAIRDARAALSSDHTTKP